MNGHSKCAQTVSQKADADLSAAAESYWIGAVDDDIDIDITFKWLTLTLDCMSRQRSLHRRSRKKRLWNSYLSKSRVVRSAQKRDGVGMAHLKGASPPEPSDQRLCRDRLF